MTQTQSSGILRSNLDPLLDRPVTSPFWLRPEQRSIDPAEKRLASRLRRLAAHALDALFLVAGAVTYVGMGAHNSGLATPMVIAYLGLAIAQVWLLTRDGQSFGKKIVGIRIVRADDGRRAGFVRVILLRALLNGLISAFLPLYGAIELLFILSPDRRCVHDLLAGTRVVRV